jgi:hypothetical protein
MSEAKHSFEEILREYENEPFENAAHPSGIIFIDPDTSTTKYTNINPPFVGKKGQCHSFVFRGGH